MKVLNRARLISACGKVPVVGPSLRRIARRYPEGSVVTIRNGALVGCRWKRGHRYVNGYWLGIYELPIQECLARELEPGNVFYDIGANAGFFTLLGARRVGLTGRVFSFEPLPENVQSVRSQLELNNVANCTLVEAAVIDRMGRVEFSEGRDTSTAHVQETTGDSVERSVISVSSVTLNDFTRDVPLPDFIKMDIEGAELLALKGATDLLGSDTPPKMLIEFHGEQLRREGCSLLRDFGYEFRSVRGDVLDATTSSRHLLCCPQPRNVE